MQYFKYVHNLYSRLFYFEIFRIVKRGDPYNSIELRIASKSIQKVLISVGFPRGPKLGKLSVPKFVYRKKSYIRSFIRGLIDTDGSVYWRQSGKSYYLILVWNTKSKSFAHEIKLLLEKLGYSPHIYSTTSKKLDSREWKIWRVYLNRKLDIKNFLSTVGFNNSTKIRQIRSKSIYLDKYGSAQIRTGDLYRVKVASYR